MTVGIGTGGGHWGQAPKGTGHRREALLQCPLSDYDTEPAMPYANA